MKKQHNKQIYKKILNLQNISKNSKIGYMTLPKKYKNKRAAYIKNTKKTPAM